jgi:calcineurin-like phosphoesterase family protein
MKYYTADEHYGHDRIIQFCNRPFSNVEDMRDTLIANHNSVVRDGDFTWHIGDVFWRTVEIAEARKILSALNGKHGLIIGNHDEVALRIAGMFNAVHDQFYDTGTKPGVFLNHFAMRVWAKSHAGSYHVFGHTHAVLPDYRRSHDVGVDANDFFPVSFDQLDELIKSKGKIEPDEVELDMTRQKWGTQ